MLMLIPPNLPERVIGRRERLFRCLVGLAIGLAVSLMTWLSTGDWHWVFAIPIFVAVAAFVPIKFPALWGADR
jgi:uncharacterized membrane protein YgaE (UPF0421/DUF939 family)